jgi:hypothetical protein
VLGTENSSRWKLRLAAAGEAEARKNGWSVAIAIADASGV